MDFVATEGSHLTRWGQGRRLEFIDFRLRWDGTINRSQIVEFFGISIQQASSDLARYSEMAPSNLVYDKSGKTYRATSTFRSLLARSDAHHYLNQLYGQVTNAASESALLIGWRPPCDVIRYPIRVVETGVLLRVLWAIRDKEDVLVLYQSMRRPAATLRWIAPHALANDGLRWHVRAWCHERFDFRDFVLSRIQRVEGMRPGTVDPKSDESWGTHTDVIVRPRPELSEAQRRAIELDYGMKDGRLVLNCRKALAFYVVRQLQLDRIPPAAALEQPLELENRVQLSELLATAAKAPEAEI